MTKHAIAYYRVSTAKQGASGLGLEAQQHSVVEFLGKGKHYISYCNIVGYI
jgi:DNA invertase Pin-like site-specific DNA recombinase